MKHLTYHFNLLILHMHIYVYTGSGRQPGDFSFDPLGFSKDAKARERYATSEVKNGMFAVAVVFDIMIFYFS